MIPILAHPNKTITTHEACEVFRALNIPMEEETLREGLRQGVFPFGVAIERKTWKFLIFKHRFRAYLEENLGINFDEW